MNHVAHPRKVDFQSVVQPEDHSFLTQIYQLTNLRMRTWLGIVRFDCNRIASFEAHRISTVDSNIRNCVCRVKDDLASFFLGDLLTLFNFIVVFLDRLNPAMDVSRCDAAITPA